MLGSGRRFPFLSPLVGCCNVDATVSVEQMAMWTGVRQRGVLRTAYLEQLSVSLYIEPAERARYSSECAPANLSDLCDMLEVTPENILNILFSAHLCLYGHRCLGARDSYSNRERIMATPCQWNPNKNNTSSSSL